MSDEMRADATFGEIHHVKPRRARGKGEVSDADEVSVTDAVLVPLKRVKRAAKQAGSYLAAGSARLRRCAACARGCRGQAGQ
jgi:hypothetical protein